MARVGMLLQVLPQCGNRPRAICRRGAVGLLAATFVALTGCGFRPLYGGDGGQDTIALLSTVAVGVIADRTGQMLRNELLDRMTPRGTPTLPRFKLDVSLSESVRNFGVRKDATTTRTSLTITADFGLVDLQSRERVFSGVSRSVNSFNIVSSEFATAAAEEDARRRAAGDLADDITARAALFMRKTAAGR